MCVYVCVYIRVCVCVGVGVRACVCAVFETMDYVWYVFASLSAQVKEFLADPSKFVVAAPVQEDTKPGDGGGETKAEEKKEESEEESDDDMGFGEFILYLVVLVWDSFPLSFNIGLCPHKK